MYHCQLRFSCIGHPCKVFEIIQSAPPLEGFTHVFHRGDTPREALAAEADVIVADLRGADASEVLKAVLGSKGPRCQVILLAEKEQAEALADDPRDIAEVWTLPMTEAEVRFQFARWQRGCKMEKDLWQTTQFLEATINSIPSLVWYKRKDGIHEKVNDSFCKTVGKTRDQVEGRDHCYIWDVGPEAAQVCAQSDNEVMTRQVTCVAEEHVQTGSDMRLLTTYKSPLYDLDGSVMGTVGVGIDITQERAYQQELVHKNHTLETIFTALDCGVLCHTVDGTRIISVNDAALRILGYSSAEEMLSSGFRMVAQSVLDEDKPHLRERIAGLKKVGESVNVEYRVRHQDGEILHVMGNIKLLEESGQPYYQRFLLDVTSQRLQERENQRRQAELVQALSIDYNVVCAFDLKTGRGDLLRLDPDSRLADRLGLSGELTLSEYMERYIREIVYAPDRDLLRRATSRERLRRELAMAKVYYVSFRIQENDEIKYYEMKAVRIGVWGNQENVVLGFRSVDGTTRNEMKQRQLLEDALVQANRASKAKSSFLSNMSHDIRTPMNAITGFTSLALAHLDERDKVGEYLGKIQISSAHLLNLLNDILDMSQIESGKLRLDEAPCNLHEVAEELWDLVATDAQSKRLDFRLDDAGVTSPNVYCDKLRLDQVLLNVLSNAVRYTQPGGQILLRVTQGPGVQPGYASYTFRIQDTGIGMSEAFLQRIYEPFERERNSTTSGIQGTGLGMAITKNIVDMMNGAIRVDSVQGEGTTVTISLTFRVNTDLPAGSAPAAPEPTSSVPLGGRVLLAEDNALNQEIAAAILEDAGFTVDTAENGQIAVDMLRSAPPDFYRLVLMDIQMPVMNGYEAAKAIRGLERKDLSSIPILAMTANAFEEDREQALRCGMNGHMAKPIDVDKLLSALKQLLN